MTVKFIKYCLISFALTGIGSRALSRSAHTPSTDPHTNVNIGQTLLRGATSDFYVSVSGQDSNNGRSPGRAFRTLSRAAIAISNAGGGTVTILAGTYALDRPVSIERTARPQIWRGFPKGAALIRGLKSAPYAFLVKSDDTRIEGVAISNFQLSGIIVQGAQRVAIVGNRISDIFSNGWTQAAVLGLEYAPRLIIAYNTIERTRYAGIELDASERGNLADVQITNNYIRQTCSDVSDCGAIYVSGRTSRNGGIIRCNTIIGFGPSTLLTSGIYLDDYASIFSVQKNMIEGGSGAAFHVHGGTDLHIENNIIISSGDLMPLRLQSEGSRSMRSIILANNIFNSPKSIDQLHTLALRWTDTLLEHDNRVVAADPGRTAVDSVCATPESRN